MKLFLISLLLIASRSASADSVSIESVQAAIKKTFGFSDVRVEITGHIPASEKSAQPCSLVLNLENGEFALYNDADENDDGLAFKSIGKSGDSIVDGLTQDESGLALHSKKVAPGTGDAEFELSVSPERLVTIKAGARLKLFGPLSKHIRSSRVCQLTSEPRIVPTWNSILSHFRKK